MSGQDVLLRVYRGDAEGGSTKDYKVPVDDGMVVLDAVHYVQANYAKDLAVRWNCKAAKCGSCSAEVNGKPALMCKTRLDDFEPGEVIEVRPLKAFPIIRDLVTDVSFNYKVNKMITPFTPINTNTDEWDVKQCDVDRAQEFRKCIECFLCQDVCHVIRDGQKTDVYDRRNLFVGPRFMVRIASLEMHPMDGASRLQFLKEEGGVGFCNITKCCTEVCPEEIHITDNAIIPLKERVIDEFFDPVMMIWRAITGKKSLAR
jgi:succinate dehydrogenase / fumarate reductase, iron-sulfur subunit